MNKKQYFFILLSSILMSLSFHPIGLHFLAWFALVPLLFVITKVKPAKAFKAGIIFGFLFSLFSLFWLVFLQIETNIKILLFFGLIILFLYFGIYYGVGFLITKKIGIWSLPLVIAGLEFIRGTGELGFPWLVFGYSQARYPLFIQQASLYGVYGLSGWLILINVILYKLIKTKTLRYLIIFIIAFGLPLIYGVVRMDGTTEEPLVIGIVQPNIDPNLKFTKAMRELTFKRLIQLSEQCNDVSLERYERSPDIIVWPETATPIFLTFPGAYQDRVYALADRIKSPIFTGTPIYDHEDREIYNGAVLIMPGKGIIEEYRKTHLVPFGEHIPFDQYLTVLKKIDVGGGDYTPGNSFTVFNSEHLTFSCLICFESIFPELSRKFVASGAGLLINITNDGWFGKISGPQQHNDMAILRTVENGVPLIRCANTGISMVVDKYGRILLESKLFTQTFILKQLSISPDKTVFLYIGNALPILCLLIATLLLILRVYKDWKRTKILTR
ncbi:MAG: apolipoprotein N-acyltransferase [bacterium]